MLSFTSKESLNFRLVDLPAVLRDRLGLAKTESREAIRPLRSEGDLAAALPQEMKCVRTDSPRECVLRIEGALDMHSAPDIRAVFDSVVEARRELVTLDLEGLTLMDSSGVGAIVSLFKRVKAAGGSVIVRGVQGQPRAVCKLLKLERVFGL